MAFNLLNMTLKGVREVIDSMGPFEVVEHVYDPSVAPDNAVTEYFMSEMDVCRKQLLAKMDGSFGLIMQAGAMQMMFGDITVQTNVKGVGGLLKGKARASVTGESAIKPLYTGNGIVLLEPTYKHIILQDLSDWGGAVVVEDGMFLASAGDVEQKAVMRSNVSSALGGGEGLFSLGLQGSGIVALESNVPFDELIIAELQNDVIRLDGSYALAWSRDLQFSVERTTKTLIGSAASGEGLVNVYRGTGRVLISPVAPTVSFAAATHN